MSPLVAGVALLLAAPPTGSGPVPGGSGSEPEAPPVLSLDWEAPAGCPGEAGLTELVTGMVARPLTAADATGLSVRGRLTRRSAERFDLELSVETESGRGVRQFEGSDCEVLTETAALIIASALEEPAPRPEPAPSDEPGPPAAAACEEAPTPTCPAPVDPPPPELGGSVLVGAAGMLGVLPRPALGSAIRVALRRRQLRVSVSFVYLFSRRTPPRAEGVQADVGAWALGARGCWAPAVRWAEFPLCGGIRAGILRGDGVGLDAPRSTRLPWVSATAGAAFVALPWSFLGFWAGVDGALAITRPGISVDEGALLHRVPLVTGAALVGVEARFGAR